MKPHPKSKLGIAIDRGRYERGRPSPESYLPTGCPNCGETLQTMNDVKKHNHGDCKNEQP